MQTKMKRIALRVVAVSMVAALGGLAIVQAQRAVQSAEEPTPRPVQRINPLRPAEQSASTQATAQATTQANTSSDGADLFGRYNNSVAAPPPSAQSAPYEAPPESTHASAGMASDVVQAEYVQPTVATDDFPSAEQALGSASARYTHQPPASAPAVIENPYATQPYGTAAAQTSADDRYAQAGDTDSGSYERYPSYNSTPAVQYAPPARYQAAAPAEATAADATVSANSATTNNAAASGSSMQMRDTGTQPSQPAAIVEQPLDASADRYAQPQPFNASAEPFAQPKPLESSVTASATPTQPETHSMSLSTGDGVSRGNTMGTGRPGSEQLEGVQTPSLTLEKRAPEEVQIGKPALFEVHVRNSGSVPAKSVEILDTVPQGMQLLSTKPQATQSSKGELVWSIGDMAPGAETTVQMELMPLSEGELGSVATVRFAAMATASTLATRPVLTMQVKAAPQVMIGEELLVDIEVTNTGTGAATGVVLSERVPTNFTHPAGADLEYEIGTLEPGEKRNLQLVLTAAQPGVAVNMLTSQGDGQARAQAQSQVEVVAPAIDVAVDGPKRRYLDRQATYNISVKNPGTAAAEEVELVAFLPKGMQFVETNNAGQYDPETHAVYWMLEQLPARESGVVQLTTLPVEAGEQKLKVQTKAQRGLEDTQEESVIVEGVAAILFQVLDLADPIEVGGETTYEIRVVNQGSKAATNLQLVAILPGEMQAISAEGPTRFQVEPQQVRFEPLATLPPDGETTFQVRAKGTAPGDMRVRVQLLSDDMRTPVTKEESTRIYADQ